MRLIDSSGCEQKYREQIVATSKPKLSVKNFRSKIIYKKYQTCPRRFLNASVRLGIRSAAPLRIWTEAATRPL
jgi:hypothetical protein